MLKKILDYFKGIKDDISEIDFYSVFKGLFLIMLWIYPFPFMLLAKTSFKYTGYAYLLTIILISYFCFIKVNEDINSAFINLYKLAEYLSDSFKFIGLILFKKSLSIILLLKFYISK